PQQIGAVHNSYSVSVVFEKGTVPLSSKGQSPFRIGYKTKKVGKFPLWMPPLCDFCSRSRTGSAPTPSPSGGIPIQGQPRCTIKQMCTIHVEVDLHECSLPTAGYTYLLLSII